MANEELRRHLLSLQQAQLDAIGCLDWEAYSELCTPDMSVFEPEAKGYLVVGMHFNETYFKHKFEGFTMLRNTIASPHIRFLGGEENPAAAVLSYARLTQLKYDDGRHVTHATQETRIWERTQPPWSGQPWGTWICVHVHRSPTQ